MSICAADERGKGLQPMADKIDLVLKTDVAKLLQVAGFRRERRLFSRWRGEVCAILYFFRSKFSGPTTEMFTIEATVTLRYLHEVSNGSAMPKSPMDAIPVIHERFGPKDDPLGQFWQVNSASDLVAISSNVQTHVRDRVLLFFEKYGTDELIERYLEFNPDKPNLVINQTRRAIILDRLGYLSQARERFRCALGEYEQLKSGLRETDRRVLESSLRNVESYLDAGGYQHLISLRAS
jgi:Domain of unknown function (DUF4304)